MVTPHRAPEHLDIRLTKSAKDHLYRTSNDLMALRKDIESTLRQREHDLFSLSRSVILYDVTISHFEGFCASNPKAKHGKNKQQRNDCCQIDVGIAFHEHGFPLAHETFEGNMSDTKTLPHYSRSSRAPTSLCSKSEGIPTSSTSRAAAAASMPTPLKKKQCGDSVLKTDKSIGAAQLGELTMTLLKAEAGFGQLKGTLGLRPNFHQLEGRVDGHMLMPSPPGYGTLRAACRQSV